MHRTLVFLTASSFLLISAGALAQQANPSNAEEDLQPITKPLRVDESVRLRVSGCAYDVRVRGKVDPVRSRGSDEPMVKPDLRLEADLQCPDDASLGFTRRITSEPISRAQLEEILANEGTIASAVGRHGCYYTPDFNVSNAGINLRDVSYRCPLSR